MHNTFKQNIIKTALERQSSTFPFRKKHQPSCKELFSRSSCKKEQQCTGSRAVVEPQNQIKMGECLLSPDLVWVNHVLAFSLPFSHRVNEQFITYSVSVWGNWLISFHDPELSILL